MLDIIIIMILLFGALIGFKRGVIKQGVITIGMILILVLSFILKNPVSSLMYKNLPFFSFGGLFENLAVLNIIVYEGFAFLIVFSVLSTIFIILIKVSSILEKILRATIVLALPSKILGMILGIFEYYLIIFVVLFILSSPIFGLNDNKLFTESKIRNIILENTPFVSDQISGSLSALDDISDLINNKDEISDSEFNCKSIDISDSRLIRIVYIRLLVMQYLVARESKVTTYGSPPVFSKILFETEVSIHTPAFHRTCIGPRHRDETGFFRYSDTLLENVSTAIFKVVNSQREFIIEQVDIHTDIKLLRLFPDKSVST